MTEMIKDNLNPEFVTPIEVTYFFEKNEKFLAKVYDVDDVQNIENVSKHDFLGELEFNLHQVVSKGKTGFTQPLDTGNTKRPKGGTITILSEEHQTDTSPETLIM